MTYIFPGLMFACSIGASFVYGVGHDWRRAVYWVAAAVITAAVTL